MADDVRVNGNLHSWASITVKINEERFTGFTSVGYSDARERVKAYGIGRHHAPRGRSRGKYTVEQVTLGGQKDTMQALRKTLADAGDGESYGDTVFQIVVQYVEGDLPPITVELEDCVWTKNTTSDEEGPDALTEEIEIDCLRIRRDGLVLFDNSEPQ